MKQGLRWIFNGLSVLSLLLCAVVLVLWAMSYRHPLTLDWHTSNARYSLASRYSAFKLDIYPATPPAPPFPTSGATSSTTTHTFFSGLTFWEHQTVYRNGTSTWTSIDDRGVLMEHWLAALALATPAVLLAGHRRHLRRRRADRLAAGLCPVCGYDLRATRDRCPECGTAILEKQNA